MIYRITTLESAWPVIKIPMGTVHQGTTNDTFLVLVGWS